jgi:hypothetical protein
MTGRLAETIGCIGLGSIGHRMVRHLPDAARRAATEALHARERHGARALSRHRLAVHTAHRGCDVASQKRSIEAPPTSR